MEKYVLLVKKKINDLLEKQKVVVVGIGGGSGSGKTYFSNLLQKELGSKSCILKMDDYYRGLKYARNMNFDEPRMQDLFLICRHLKKLKEEKRICKRIYDFAVHLPSGKYEYFYSKPVVIIEGLFALHEKVLSAVDVRLFIKCDDKVRFERRLKRDIIERGRTKESVYEQYNSTVRPMYKMYVEPTIKNADVVIDN